MRRPRPLLVALGGGALLLAGCLERSTGEGVELDPRFVERGTGGPKITVRGTIEAPGDGPVTVDFAVAAPDAPGGTARLGKEELDGPGPFEVELPEDIGAVVISAFQDPGGDGPDASDPFAHLELTVAEQDVAGLVLPLEEGGFEEASAALRALAGDAAGGGAGPSGDGPVHAEVPHGDGTPTLTAPAAAARTPTPDKVLFSDVDGATISLRGVPTGPAALPVDLAVELADGRSDQTLLPIDEEYMVELPRGLGQATVVAWQDLQGDGLTDEDPVARRAVELGELDVDGLDLSLALPDGVDPAVLTATPAAAPQEGVAAPVELVEVPHQDAAVGAPGGEPVAASPGPYDEHDGPTVVVRGTVRSSSDRALDLDLRQPDPDAEGGVADLGKVLLAGPGAFEVKVPRGLGELQLEGFQDADGNGPDVSDPWGMVLVDVGEEDVADVQLVLVAGARGTGAAHAEVPHAEAEVGAAGRVELERVGVPVNPSGVGPFANQAGPTVSVRGTVKGDTDDAVDLDLWVGEGAEKRNQGKVVLVAPGEFTIKVPREVGTLTIEAYQDQDVDGPTEVDPYDELSIVVGREDITGLVVALERTGAALAQGAPGQQGDAPPPGPTGPPFEDHDGRTLTVRGLVTADTDGSVQVDVRIPDADAPGGMRMEGKLQLDGPGAFQFKVPVEQGVIELEAFQDPDTNGPDDDDPYARERLEIADRDAEVVLALEEGGRAKAAAAGAAPPSAGAAPSAGGGGAPFSAVDGPRITVSGTLTWAGEGSVDVDIFELDATAPGGRRIAGKLRLQPGPFSFEVPTSVDRIAVEAFVDVDSDGPSPTDPSGRYAGNPLTIGDVDIDGVDVTVSAGAAGGAAAPAAGAPAGG